MRYDIIIVTTKENGSLPWFYLLLVYYFEKTQYSNAVTPHSHVTDCYKKVTF